MRTRKSQNVGRRSLAWSVLGVLALAGCGGGGGGDGAPTQAAAAPAPTPPAGSGSSAITWTSGVFQPATSFRSQCLVPRTGTTDVQGSTLAENNWLRSWTNELYLWYQEVQDVDPANYATPAYFNLLKTFQTTPSGAPKDRFHFTYPTSDWIALAQSGIAVDYGAEWIVIGTAPSRQIVVAFSHPTTPAAAANFVRGTRVLSIDGVPVATANAQSTLDVLNRALSPTQAGEVHEFVVQRPGTAPGTVSLQAVSITRDPVQHVKTLPPSGTVGYLLFTDHLATAERELIEAIETLRSARVTDLVLDLRYNGGGFLDIAAQLAYMIAGPARTAGLTFEALRFNDKHPSTDPVTGMPLVPMLFPSTARGFSAPPGTPLPTLDLPRVFVLTGPGTCSASESIINGLRGIGFEVIQVGSTTCGKPYGFYPTDNCGTTYFSIQFKGVNASGFGDYTDGFRPATGLEPADASLPGCSVADDFSRELGDPLEARLAAALQYRDGRGCPVPSGTAKAHALHAIGDTDSDGDGLLVKSPWLQNRTLTGP
jgi:carboxyl-terminal processing protease